MDRTNLTKVRPSNDIGERVVPSDFEAYRLSHDIQGPCCLCPLLHEDVGAFAEATMKMVVRGRHAGEYAVMCAKDRCGYFGNGNGLALDIADEIFSLGGTNASSTRPTHPSLSNSRSVRLTRFSALH
jgi:hypothetical protein